MEGQGRPTMKTVRDRRKSRVPSWCPHSRPASESPGVLAAEWRPLKWEGSAVLSVLGREQPRVIASNHLLNKRR